MLVKSIPLKVEIFYMLNLYSYNNYSNASILKPGTTERVVFTGDKNLLKGFYKYGIINKEQVLTDQFNFKRSEIDESAILKSLLDKDNTRPVLITGKPQSGKSVVAGRLINQLRDKGHKVFVVENDITSDVEAFGQAEIKLLIQQIKALNPTDRVYLFIDEPQFIPGRERYINPDIEETPEESVLSKLAQFVDKNKNVKLVGVMYDGGLTYGLPFYNYLLEDMFPKKNHIVVPEINKQDKIEMINTVLKIAGFNKIPVDVANRMRLMPLEVRECIKKIFVLLFHDHGRVDDINTVEDIKPDNWRILMSQLQDRM